MLQVREDETIAQASGVTRSSRTHSLTGVRMAINAVRRGEPQFYQIVGMMLRRRRLIIGIAGIGTLVAVVVALLIPPKYTATAQLIVDFPAGGDRGAAVAALDESMDTHLTLINSRDNLQRVVDNLSVKQNTAPSVPAESHSTQDENGIAVLRAWADFLNATGTADFVDVLKHRLKIWFRGFHRNEVSRGVSVDELMRNMNVTRERRSRIISIAYTSTMPEEAAAIANRIAHLYVDGLAAQMQESAEREMARLDEQLAALKYEMEQTAIAARKAIEQRSSGEAATARKSGSELREIEGQAAQTAQLYDQLLRRKKQMREQQESMAPDARIYALASAPPRPSSHNPILFILPGLLILLIGGSWLAVILEQLDRRLRSEEETSEALGIPCIGLVPMPPRKAAALAARCVLKQPFSPYAEAIRSAAMTLRLAGIADGPQVILVSSSVANEGKTTLAVSLSTYVALLGRRVLLIDINLRQKSLFKWQDKKAPRKPLDEKCLADESVQTVSEFDFDYLPMRCTSRDPLSLFTSEQLERRINDFRDTYDVVILDGPPVLGVAEARLLAPVVDKVLFVVKWGSTRREVARNALSLIHDIGHGEPPLSILTQVNLSKHAQYRFGDIGELFANSKARCSRLPTLRWR